MVSSLVAFEKLIDTIRSRTTIVNFTKATKEETKRSLKRIVPGEKLKINDEDIEKIIKLSRGSFRDAVKLLEQYSKDNKFLDGLQADSSDLLMTILKKDVDKSIEIIKKSSNIENLTDDLLDKLHKLLIESQNTEIIPLMEFILTSKDLVKYSPIEELPLELAIIKWVHSKNG